MTIKKDDDGSELTRLAIASKKEQKFALGRWKIKKLEEVGNDADKSLLNNRVSEKHHQRLRDFFVKRWGELNKAQELN